jgi:hypothetical protein
MRACFSILFGIWFLLGSFMPGNDAEELAKMPLLYQHFQQHLQSGEVDGMLDFIKVHYSSSSSSDSEHQELPFVKHLQPCLIFILPQVSCLPDPRLVAAFTVLTFPDLVPSLLSASIEAWQPPRIS